MSRKLENATRVDAYGYDPKDLCIVGGKDLPDPRERGPLDTPIKGIDSFLASLVTHDLLKPIDDLDVDDIVERGLMKPIEAVMYQGIPRVVFGRGGVRKSRRANLIRKEKGQPPVVVKVSFTRETNPLALQWRVVSENLRRKALSVLDRIEMAVMLLNGGASEESVAKAFGVKQQRFKDWLALKDHATGKVKAALAEGRINPSASIELALHAKDPEAMDKALDAMLQAGATTSRAARRAARAASGKDNHERVTRRDLKRLHEEVKGSKSHDLLLIAETIEVVLGTRTKGRVYEMLQESRKASKG